MLNPEVYTTIQLLQSVPPARLPPIGAGNHRLELSRASSLLCDPRRSYSIDNSLIHQVLMNALRLLRFETSRAVRAHYSDSK